MCKWLWSVNETADANQLMQVCPQCSAWPDNMLHRCSFWPHHKVFISRLNSATAAEREMHLQHISTQVLLTVFEIIAKDTAANVSDGVRDVLLERKYWPTLVNRGRINKWARQATAPGPRPSGANGFRVMGHHEAPQRKLNTLPKTRLFCELLFPKLRTFNSMGSLEVLSDGKFVSVSMTTQQTPSADEDYVTRLKSSRASEEVDLELRLFGQLLVSLS